jgi:signal transduction histidine kinase
MDVGQKPVSLSNSTFDLSAFVRGLTHEIANPLNAISMNCDLLRLVADRGDMERVREAVARLLASSARGAVLTRSLQAFGTALRRNPAELIPAGSLLEGAIRAVAIKQEGRIPRFQIDGGNVPLHADRAALENAFAALLRNAVEAGSDSIEIRVREEGGRVVVDICDDGPGFSEYDLAKIDTPFYSTRRAPGNVGLGLTLVREVLRANRGLLRILPAQKGAHVEISFLATEANASRADSMVGP